MEPKMKKQKTTTTVQNFPDDLIPEIMAALPAKSIIRFHCLSKSRQAFLTSPRFSDMHLNHQTKTQPKSERLIVSSGKTFRLIGHQENNKEIEIPLESISTEQNMEKDVLGSCNGLLLVAVNGEGLKLWNPTTGKCQKLPSPCPLSNDDKGTFGFGYDKSTNDFKVIRFHYVFNNLLDDLESAVHIYSLRSNTWKKINDFPISIGFTDQSFTSGTFVDEFIYWIVKNPSLGKWVLGFNLKSEKFEKIRLPNDLNSPQGESLLGLGVINECLSLAENHHGFIDTWKLGRDENSTWLSWIKIMSVINLEELPNPYCWLPDLNIMNNGEVLFSYFYVWDFLGQDSKTETVVILQTKGFQLYDPFNGRFRRLNVGDNMEQCRQAITFVESLVSPKVVGNESNPTLQLEAKEFTDLYGKDWSKTF